MQKNNIQKKHTKSNIQKATYKTQHTKNRKQHTNNSLQHIKQNTYTAERATTCNMDLLSFPTHGRFGAGISEPGCLETQREQHTMHKPSRM